MKVGVPGVKLEIQISSLPQPGCLTLGKRSQAAAATRRRVSCSPRRAGHGRGEQGGGRKAAQRPRAQQPRRQRRQPCRLLPLRLLRVLLRMLLRAACCWLRCSCRAQPERRRRRRRGGAAAGAPAGQQREAGGAFRCKLRLQPGRSAH